MTPVIVAVGKNIKIATKKLIAKKKKNSTIGLKQGVFCDVTYFDMHGMSVFNEAVAEAMPFYWNDLYDYDNAEEMSQPEALRFFDWFCF